MCIAPICNLCLRFRSASLHEKLRLQHYPAWSFGKMKHGEMSKHSFGVEQCEECSQMSETDKRRRGARLVIVWLILNPFLDALWNCCSRLAKRCSWQEDLERNQHSSDALDSIMLDLRGPLCCTCQTWKRGRCRNDAHIVNRTFASLWPVSMRSLIVNNAHLNIKVVFLFKTVVFGAFGFGQMLLLSQGFAWTR